MPRTPDAHAVLRAVGINGDLGRFADASVAKFNGTSDALTSWPCIIFLRL